MNNQRTNTMKPLTHLPPEVILDLSPQDARLRGMRYLAGPYSQFEMPMMRSCVCLQVAGGKQVAVVEFGDGYRVFVARSKIPKDSAGVNLRQFINAR